MKLKFISSLGFLLFSLMLMSPHALAYCGDGILEESAGEQCDDANFINKDGCNSYCKLEDVTPPEVSFMSILANASSVPTNTKEIQIVFSEAIDPNTVNKGNIYVEHEATPLQQSVEVAGSNKVIIKIEEALFGEARHAIHVKQVKDIEGNIMPDETIRAFDTGVFIDEIAPTPKITPEAGEYYFTQNMEIKAYLEDYTGSDVFLDEGATIYYTTDGSYPTSSSPVYTEAFKLREDKTIRFFAVDESGNKSTIHTAKYTFDCPDRPNSKEVEPFPSCQVVECVLGYRLQNNACVISSEEASDERNAVTAPLFSSNTQIVISSKPAIKLEEEHNGQIRRPIKFVDPKGKSTLYFAKDTEVTTLGREPYVGLIRPPVTLYQKDFPINFGYTFKSIVDFSPSEDSVSFSPAYKLVVPYTESYDENETVYVFTFDEEKYEYRPYDIRSYEVDLYKKEVAITARSSRTFFIAQEGKSFNKAEFTDTENHWARNYAESLFRRGIVKGKKKGIYAPYDPLSRAEFTKIALNAIGEEVEALDEVTDTYFDDVSIYSWYVPYVNKSKELGLVKGYDDGTFRPDQPINRAEAIKILVNALEINTDDLGGHSDNTRAYKDVLEDQWYFKPMRFVIEHGMLDGLRNDNDTGFFPDWYGPDRPISRGEMAKLAVEILEWKEAEDSK